MGLREEEFYKTTPREFDRLIKAKEKQENFEMEKLTYACWLNQAFSRSKTLPSFENLFKKKNQKKKISLSKKESSLAVKEIEKEILQGEYKDGN